MIKDDSAGGMWDKGRFFPYPDAAKEEIDIIVNICDNGTLEEIENRIKAIRYNIDEIGMTLDETFNSAGFEQKEKHTSVGMVNRVKLAGLTAFRVATCPFRKKP